MIKLQVYHRVLNPKKSLMNARVKVLRTGQLSLVSREPERAEIKSINYRNCMKILKESLLNNN